MTFPRLSDEKGSKINSILALLATLVAILFHCIFLGNAGGLWRDEAGLVQLAVLPSWHDLWGTLTHDSFPVLMPALVRLWSDIGFGNSDLGLRLLGLLIGLLLLASFWITHRTMRGGLPLLSLALVAVNATAIRFGDSLRAYGLGSALNVLTLALVWRVVKTPTWTRSALAALTAILAVQCLYQNAVFILAACCAGAIVGALERRWRVVFHALGIGLVAALSMLPYIQPIIQSQDWWIVEKTGFHFDWVWRKLVGAAGFPMHFYIWLWIALCVWALCVGLRRQAKDADRLALFSAISLAIGIVGFLAFLKTADLPTQSWYYLPLVSFVAICLDVILAERLRSMCLCFALFFSFTLVASCVRDFSVLKFRQTNIDLVATALNQQVSAGDYVIVYPWCNGVSFNRYYRGAAPWATLPPLEDHAVHRYDQFKMRVQEEQPIASVIEHCSATLKAGHRVWIVGSLDFSDKAPPAFTPAPNNPWGWADVPYSIIFEQQTGYYISHHATDLRMAAMTDANIAPFENTPLFTATGWKE